MCINFKRQYLCIVPNRLKTEHHALKQTPHATSSSSKHSSPRKKRTYYNIVTRIFFLLSYIINSNGIYKQILFKKSPLLHYNKLNVQCACKRKIIIFSCMHMRAMQVFTKMSSSLFTFSVFFFFFLSHKNS